MDIHSSSPHLYHFLSGSFRSLSLFLLAFSPIHRTITHVQTIPAFGPHQYLAANNRKDRVFTTSWALPPSLSCWTIERGDRWNVTHLNTVSITATSSYVDIPPPFTHVYSVGGPTGEVHVIDPHTGGFGEKTQEVLFIPQDQLASADKTRVALRYGSHGIESTSTPSYSLTFVPDLGPNTIEVYSRNSSSGILTHLSSTHSPRGADAHDGPRHVKIHPNGRILYCVTEHTNFVDLYEITPPTLTYIASRSLLPEHLQASSNKFRGDTLLLTPSTSAHHTPYALVATTRGSMTSVRGWLNIFALDQNGHFIPEGQNHTDNDSQLTKPVVRYETPTSGGKANAIDLLPRFRHDLASPHDNNDEGLGSNFRTDEHVNLQDQVYLSSPFADRDKPTDGIEEGLWILLTDDDDATATSYTGGVKVLEWDGWKGEGVHVAAEWPTPSESASQSEGDGYPERMMGGSHAIWLG